MKITYDFSKCIMEGISFCFYSQEVPYILGKREDECLFMWFSVICEETKTPWFISIHQIDKSRNFELRAVRAKPDAILLFGEYVLYQDAFACSILGTALESRDDYLSRELKNIFDLNAVLNSFFKEVETIEGSEVEILDLRNVHFWTEVLGAESPELAEFLAETRENISVSDETNDIPF